MPTRVVLLHSPLVGPGTWRLLAPLLRERRHDVAVADYSDVMLGEPPYYDKIARRAAEAAGAQDSVILVAHSGAGALVPAIAAACETRVAGVVFVDALLPHPGKPWFDMTSKSLNAHIRNLARDGRVPPWQDWWPKGAIESLFPDRASYERFASELHRLPIAYFEEPAPAVVMPDHVACAYLQLGPAYEAEAAIAEAQGWPTKSVSLHHLAMLTHPADVAAALDPMIHRVSAA